MPSPTAANPDRPPEQAARARHGLPSGAGPILSPHGHHRSPQPDHACHTSNTQPRESASRPGRRVSGLESDFAWFRWLRGASGGWAVRPSEGGQKVENRNLRKPRGMASYSSGMGPGVPRRVPRDTPSIPADWEVMPCGCQRFRFSTF